MQGELLETSIRLAAAAALGAALGLTRDVKGKPAGLRTMGLVSLGSAVAALTAAQYFSNADPAAQSRAVQGVIQGVLTGVGFIGAGAVLHGRDQSHVHGLTTAAIVWVAAATGIACGLGIWPPVLIGAGVALVLIVVLHPIEKAIERRAKQSPPPDDDDD